MRLLTLTVGPTFWPSIFHLFSILSRYTDEEARTIAEKLVFIYVLRNWPCACRTRIKLGSSSFDYEPYGFESRLISSTIKISLLTIEIILESCEHILFKIFFWLIISLGYPKNPKIYFSRPPYLEDNLIRGVTASFIYIMVYLYHL